MISNLISGKGNKEEQNAGKPVQPSLESLTKLEKNTDKVSESFFSHDESAGLDNANYRKFMTPQLSAEFSQYSGLSLMKLEEDKNTSSKNEKLSNFYLRNGKPFVIGVCGGNCAGKMDLVNYLVQKLGEKRCTIVKQENFYHMVSKDTAIADHNYDDPDSTDWEYMQTALDALLLGNKPFHTPIYNFKLSKRELKTEEITPNPIIIVEGLLIFHYERIRNRLDLKIFLDTDDDIRLSRRIMKGYLELGRDVDTIVERYKKFVKPCHETYVLPSRQFADIIVPNFGISVCEELDVFVQKKENQNKDHQKQNLPKVNVALELLVEQIKYHLEDKDKFRMFQKV